MNDDVVFLKNANKVMRRVVDDLDSDELTLDELEALSKVMDKNLKSNVRLGKKIRKALKRFD